MEEAQEAQAAQEAETMSATASNESGQSLADLSIKDLLALRSIIDLASQRGAFKPSEMVSVGQNYNKLDNFLNIVIEQQRREEAANKSA